jgi:DNA replication and repair protein RecF
VLLPQEINQPQPGATAKPAAQGMQIRRLSLTNFRNFVRLEVEFPPGILILVGANAQGKTSLLEAIYYLAAGSSPFSESDRRLINFLALTESLPLARLRAEVSGRGRTEQLEIRLYQEADENGESRLRKDLLVQGIKRRPAEFPGHLLALLFMPQELRVVEGPPSERRRHLDDLLVQVDAAYARSLGEYQHALTQRNALLRELQEHGGDPAQLDYWDQQLVSHGAYLIHQRALVIAELERRAVPIHRNLSRGREGLRLEYQPSVDPLRPQGRTAQAQQSLLPLAIPVDRTRCSPEEIRNEFSLWLQSSRAESIARGRTFQGPHRDEVRFLVDGVDLGHYGSRGQARTCLLALKLAEVDWTRERCQEWPVLLLDEALAELDRERRDLLVDQLGGAEQVLITTAEPEALPARLLAQAHRWRVEAGSLHPEH